MKTIGDFEDLIVLHVPDAPSAVMQHVLRHAITRFMRESQIFTDFMCLESQCGVPEYPLELPECRRLVGVEAVEVGKDADVSLSEIRPNAGKGWEWYMDSMYPVVVLLYPPKKDGEKIHVMYSWTIARDDCEVPDELYEIWAEAIKCAALADLFAMPSQEWSNLGLSRLYENYYSVELGLAKSRRWHNYSRGSGTVQSRPFLSPRR